MRDILRACSAFFHGLAQTSTALLDFLLAVIEFNFHAVSTLVLTVCNACSALATLLGTLGNAVLEIVYYISDFLWEVAYLFYSCARVLGKLLALLKQLVLYAADGLSYIFYGVQYSVVFLFTQLVKLISFPWQGVVSLFGVLKYGLNWAWHSTSSVAESAFSSISHSSSFVFTYISGIGYGLYEHIADLLSALFETIQDLTFTGYDSIKSCLFIIVNGIFLNTPREIYVYLGLFVVSVFSINWILKYLHKRGLTLPFIQYRSRLRARHHPAGDDFFSDSSDNEEYWEEDLSSNHSSQTFEDHESDGLEEDEVEEYEVVSDSETDSASDDEEEQEVEVIDIQLPHRTGRYNLRNRPSPPPVAESKLTPAELERFLGNEREKRVCVVCQDQVKTVLVLPCRHMCLCVDCAHEITAQRNVTRRVCPLCRTRMETVMNIYV